MRSWIAIYILALDMSLTSDFWEVWLYRIYTQNGVYFINFYFNILLLNIYINKIYTTHV